MSHLDDVQNRHIASINGIQPEQVTDSFLRAMRERMEQHPFYEKQLTREEQIQWDQICKTWAQEIVGEESTHSSEVDYSNRELRHVTRSLNPRE
jgi:hypothetical protein